MPQSVRRDLWVNAQGLTVFFYVWREYIFYDCDPSTDYDQDTERIGCTSKGTWVRDHREIVVPIHISWLSVFLGRHVYTELGCDLDFFP